MCPEFCGAAHRFATLKALPCIDCNSSSIIQGADETILDRKITSSVGIKRHNFFFLQRTSEPSVKAYITLLNH